MQTTWRPFAWVDAALCVGTMGTALASPLYPFYQLLWDLKPSIFILYGLRSVRQEIKSKTCAPARLAGRFMLSWGYANQAPGQRQKNLLRAVNCLIDNAFVTDANGLIVNTGRAYHLCCACNQRKIGNGLMRQEEEGFITVLARTHTAYPGISFFQFILLEAAEFQLMIIIVVEPYFHGR